MTTLILQVGAGMRMLCNGIGIAGWRKALAGVGFFSTPKSHNEGNIMSGTESRVTCSKVTDLMNPIRVRSRCFHWSAGLVEMPGVPFLTNAEQVGVFQCRLQIRTALAVPIRPS